MECSPISATKHPTSLLKIRGIVLKVHGPIKQKLPGRCVCTDFYIAEKKAENAFVIEDIEYLSCMQLPFSL